MTGPSKEYAEALYLLGKEQQNLQKLLEDVCLLENVIKENPEYLDFLSSPAVPQHERQKALEEAVGTLDETIVSFLKLLLENGRIKQLLEIINEFKRFYNEGILKSNATITSAILLSESDKNAILKKLENVLKREIEPTFCVDKSILGGLKIEVDGKVYDGSIKHTLNDVKDVITR